MAITQAAQTTRIVLLGLATLFSLIWVGIAGAGSSISQTIDDGWADEPIMQVPAYAFSMATAVIDMLFLAAMFAFSFFLSIPVMYDIGVLGFLAILSLASSGAYIATFATAFSGETCGWSTCGTINGITAISWCTTVMVIATTSFTVRTVFASRSQGDTAAWSRPFRQGASMFPMGMASATQQPHQMYAYPTSAPVPYPSQPMYQPQGAYAVLPGGQAQPPTSYTSYPIAPTAALSVEPLTSSAFADQSYGSRV